MTKPVVMGGHRGFIVHFDWTRLQEVVVVGGVGGVVDVVGEKRVGPSGLQ